MQIDLRSDTVTHPTQAMREAMYHAEVGDDVYGEDPTVNRLQELAAERTGKEAAIFVPSGTMGNAIALLTHAGRGQAIIVGDESHIYHYEAGAASTLGGSPLIAVPTHADGMLNMDETRVSIADESDAHVAATALICIENTHNRRGGTVLSAAQITEVAQEAHTRGRELHIDGARIFNAATALNVPVSELARPVDSLMFCLSKGLSAPVGSMLVGNTEFIRRAHRVRKLLGGGMRQAGVLAAAGIIALEQMVERLAEDHENCELLAHGVADYPQIGIQPERVMNNMLLFTVHDAQQRPLMNEALDQFIARAHEHGVLLDQIGKGKIRAVTHYGLTAEDITNALVGIRRALIEMKL